MKKMLLGKLKQRKQLVQWIQTAKFYTHDFKLLKKSVILVNRNALNMTEDVH